MKKCILILFLLITSGSIYACPVCEKQQPKILSGITHGGGPESRWDYVIVWIGVVIVLITLIYTLKWIFRPGENSKNHIKQFILNIE
jgi:uncharacterized protein HemY